jgi:parallel beta-helix repeat protein
MIGFSPNINADGSTIHQDVASLHPTVYVDDDNVLGPWDGTIEYPYQTIGDGITHVEENGTIFVFKGAYYEDCMVSKKLTLRGEDRRLTACFSITLNTAAIDVSGFSLVSLVVFSNNNTIHENRIEGGGSLCLSGTAAQNILRNNTIENAELGISFSDESKENLIEQNLVQNNEIGISLKGIKQTIRYNYFFQNSVGILSSSSNQTIIYNIFIENSVGVESRERLLQIEKNLFTRNTKGVELVKGKSQRICGNVFRLNEVGLSMEECQDCIVVDNNFYGNLDPIVYILQNDNLLELLFNYHRSGNVIERNFPRPFVIFITFVYITWAFGFYHEFNVPICRLVNLFPRLLPYEGFDLGYFSDNWPQDTFSSGFLSMEG